MYNFNINLLKMILIEYYDIDISILIDNFESNIKKIDVININGVYKDNDNNEYKIINKKIGKKII